MPQTEISTAGRWTVEEHEKFLLGLQLFGKNWKKIEEIIGTRNGAQIRSHAQKYFLKLRKEGKQKQDSQDISSEKEQDNSAPIQRSIVIQNKEESSDCSYFMGKILEFARYHENVEIWDALIDSGSHKETATETEFCNDCLHQQKDSAQFQENFQKDITR